MNNPKLATNRERRYVSNAQLIHYLLLFALAWAIAQVLAYFATVLVIFIFAAILAFLLNYPITFVSRFMPRWLAALLVFLLTFLILGGLLATLGLAIFSQAQQLLEQAPQFLESAIAWLENLQTFLENRNVTVDFTTFETQLREQFLGFLSLSFAMLQNVLLNLIDVILIAVVSFFMLLDGKQLWRLVMKLFPLRMRLELTEVIQRNFIGFFWGRLLLSIFLGMSTFVVFLLLGVPYALVMAALVSIFDLIPGIGATIGVSLVCAIVLPQGILLSLKVLIASILLQQVQENFLMPRLMKDSININPVVMFFALLIGARVAGLIGVFLSVPVAGVLISLLDIDEMRGEQAEQLSH